MSATEPRPRLAVPRSRRHVLRAAGGGAAAALSPALLAGCGGDDDDETDPERDLLLLNAALDLEHGLIAAYDATEGLLRGDARRSARRFREHEREHASRIEAAVRQVGGRPRRPAPAADYRRGFPRMRDEREALSFAVDMENSAVAGYLESIPRITTTPVRAEVSTILTIEAEHLALMLQASGKPPAPAAFVDGRL